MGLLLLRKKKKKQQNTFGSKILYCRAVSRGNFFIVVVVMIEFFVLWWMKEGCFLRFFWVKTQKGISVPTPRERCGVLCRSTEHCSEWREYLSALVLLHILFYVLLCYVDNYVMLFCRYIVVLKIYYTVPI